MIDAERDAPKVVPIDGGRSSGEQLEYSVELWDHDRSQMERVLGRASSAQLARAIFAAARTEHPERYLVLKLGNEVLADAG